MKTNNSIFKRVLAMVLCVLMCAGVLTACFQMPEFNPGVGMITNGNTTPSTGDKVENEPNEDPVDPVDPEPVDPNLIFSASTTIDSSDLLLGSLTNDVVISGEGATALVPSDVKVETGASSIALTLKNVEENEVDFGDAELLNNLDVHISGIALDNTTPMTVMLGAILPIGLANTELKLYHIENGTPVLMTRVNSAVDFAIHNQYVYDSETGNVTIYVASFSVFAMVKATADVWDGTSDYSWYNTTDTTFTLATAEQFAGFRDIVDGTAVINDAKVQDSFAGKTVILGADIDLNKINFDPIGYGYTINKDSNTAFMGTFDGGNHTVYNLYEQGWDLESATGNDYTYSTAGAGLFGTIENATIKNLAVSGAEIKMECVDMGIVVGYAQGTCHFENIVVTNSKIANYQRATGGVVGEVCYGPYGTDTKLGYSHTFKNIIVDSSVTVGSLWGDFDNLNGGVIGGKWGDATVWMEDVTVAVTLDAYSDVTSAYQWYAYRRSGMLIGHTEQNSPKKAETADAPFLTCKNVTVYYGDWVNYTYCQFEHTNNPGYRYPWVRVEEGRNCGAYSNPRYGHPIDFAGKEVISAEHTHAEGEGHNVLIKFDQLYGGGQGVYGKADHTGVTVVDKNTTTLYIKTNATNVKLFYWYDTTWTNVVDGIELVGQDGTFRADIPAYAQGFKLVVDGVESDSFLLAGYEDGETITLGQAPSCDHEYDNACDATCNKCEETREVGEHVYDNACDADCNVCDAERTPAEHVYDNACDADCNVCDAERTPADHVYDNACDATCNVCNATREIGDHVYTETVTKTPTCEETGVKTFTCTCGDTYTEVIPATGHTAGAAVVENNVASSCTDKGSYDNVVYCTVCEVELSRETITVDEKGHTPGAEATCTTAQTCTVCSAVIKEALGHDMVIDAAVAPTCTTTGLTEGSHCSRCDHVVAQEVLDKVAHTEVVDEAVAATCTTTGLTEGSHCSVCDEVLVAQKTVAALGHTWNISTHKCSVCGVSAPTKTIYFKNEWVWSDVRIYYWYTTSSGTVNNTMPGTKMTKVDNDGTYDYYTYEVPEYLTGFIILDASQMDKTGYVPDNKKTPDIVPENVEDNEMFYMFYNGSATKPNQVKSEDYASYKAKFTVMYLKPNSNWTQAGARFAVYAFNSDSDNCWLSMSDPDKDGIYQCWVPKTYKKMIYVRMNGSTTDNNWDNKWNQSGDLTIPTNGNNLLTMSTSTSVWDGFTTTWSTKK